MIDWLLIYKNITNKATESEQNEYSKWLKESRHHQRYSEKLADYHQKDGEFSPLSNEMLVSKFHELQCSRIRKKNKTRTISLVISSAAAALVVSWFVLLPDFTTKKSVTSTVSKEIEVPTLILESGNNIALEGNPNIDNESLIEKIADKTISYRNRDRKPTEIPTFNTLVIPSCYTYTIILDDSTEVLLNANSQLRYPVKFTGDKREVFLKGEAYFKVSKSHKPFIVTADETYIKVYGTEFNIQSFGNNRVKTVLVSGSVGVGLKRNLREKMIKPNQMTIVDSQNGAIEISDVDVKNHTAWIAGYFRYDSQKIGDAIDELSRWYGVEFKFSDPKESEEVITALFEKSSNLDKILLTIEKATALKFIRKGGSYIIE